MRTNGGAWSPAMGIDGLAVVATFIFAIGTLIRFRVGWNLPLWVDESFTGAIANQSDLAGLFHQIRADVNAPFYYLVMYAWSSVAGVSNMALRLPSAVFVTGAVVLAFRGTAGLDRRLCLLWGSLLCLWQPGLFQASEARCYALLLLISTAGTLAFVRLLLSPARPVACVWAAFGSLGILTHYYALPLVVAQGATVLWLHRARAARTWPAIALFLPALAWIGYHAVRLSAFAKPDIAWYSPLGPSDLPWIVGYVLNLAGVLALLVGVLILVLGRRNGDSLEATLDGAIPRAVAAASLAGLIIVVAIGMVRPSFSLRYCVPFVPGLLLGVALVIREASRVWPRFSVTALMVFGLPGLLLPAPTRAFSFEAASQALAEAGTRRLVFLWDHPSSPVQDPAQMRAVGGFFLARAGHPVEVVDVANPWRDDPQPRLLAAAGSDPDTAILWLYDAKLPKTAALAHPPQIERVDPSWRCRDHAGGRFVALVCLRARS